MPFNITKNFTIVQPSTIVPKTLPIIATGGTITTNGDYKTHTFSGDGTFSVSQGGGPLYFTVRGAGGGGTSGNSQPGHPGGRSVGTGSLTAGVRTFTVKVGTGGLGTAGSGGAGGTPGGGSGNAFGGGGGGYSGIFEGTISQANAVIIAGGGSGAKQSSNTGAAFDGGYSGAGGAALQGSNASPSNNGGGGGGYAGGLQNQGGSSYGAPSLTGVVLSAGAGGSAGPSSVPRTGGAGSVVITYRFQ